MMLASMVLALTLISALFSCESANIPASTPLEKILKDGISHPSADNLQRFKFDLYNHSYSIGWRRDNDALMFEGELSSETNISQISFTVSGTTNLKIINYCDIVDLEAQAFGGIVLIVGGSLLLDSITLAYFAGLIPTLSFHFLIQCYAVDSPFSENEGLGGNVTAAKDP